MDWTIGNLEYVLQEQELKDVVIIAHWGVSKEVEGVTASSYGTQSFPTPTGDFIPYEDLTEAEVIAGLLTQWVQIKLSSLRHHLIVRLKLNFTQLRALVPLGLQAQGQW